MPKPSANLNLMIKCALCPTLIRSDKVKCWRMIEKKSQQVCPRCFDEYRAEVRTEVKIKGSIVKDEKLGNKIVWK